MQPDDHVCLCFGVSLRKVVNYCRREKPKAASQISGCLSAGTGCGWCRPMLRRIHADVAEGGPLSADEVDPESYARDRAAYRKAARSRPAESEPAADDRRDEEQT